MSRVGVIVHLSYKEGTPDRYLHDYYSDVARMFSAEILMVDTFGRMNHLSNVVSTFDQAISQFESLSDRVVFLCPGVQLDLGSFCHPGNVVYVVGPDHYYKEPPIENPIRVSIGQDTIWGHQALAIVLWDRVVKDGTWLSL